MAGRRAGWRSGWRVGGVEVRGPQARAARTVGVDAVLCVGELPRVCTDLLHQARVAGLVHGGARHWEGPQAHALNRPVRLEELLHLGLLDGQRQVAHEHLDVAVATTPGGGIARCRLHLGLLGLTWLLALVVASRGPLVVRAGGPTLERRRGLWDLLLRKLLLSLVTERCEYALWSVAALGRPKVEERRHWRR